MIAEPRGLSALREDLPGQFTVDTETCETELRALLKELGCIDIQDSKWSDV